MASKPLRPEDSLEMFSGTDSDRAEALAIQTAADLTAEMRKPLKDISTQAGEMERDSPLFYGTGANPTLF